ncbi:MAG: DMT family transporter [Oscillospiraceae bacterium]|nr:DMT family transporter [Oscillospiraceae bacterium]
MWFTLSLFTVVAWGGSDLFSKKGTRPEDKCSHLKLVITVGTVMLIHAVVYLAVSGVRYDPRSIIRYFPVSAMYILSMVIGYAGLRYIRLSVSSPICNSSGAVTALLCFAVLGQTMEFLQFIGVFLICLGILLLSVFEKRGEEKEKAAGNAGEIERSTPGVIAILFPILYCVIDGMGSFMDALFLERIMDEAEANLSYEFTFAVCAFFSWLYIRFKKRERFSYFRQKDFCLAAICETAGQFSYIYALGDNAVVAAPMIASYSIFSVVLSRIFLKEKLKNAQYAVIAMVMIGIAILGFFDS